MSVPNQPLRLPLDALGGRTTKTPIDSFGGEHRFLSNFAPIAVELEPGLDAYGIRYATVEHAYQAAKTLSAAERDWVREASTPGEAKRRGKRVALRSDWDSVKDAIMLDLLRQKFAHPAYRAALLRTGDRELIESNTWRDQYWGVYMGKGQNKLGRLLMQVRSEIG